jgi:hypothetical protein
MEKFIRLDEKGHWRGAEHRSSIGGMAGEWDDECFCDVESEKCTCGAGTDRSWEKGISCYTLKHGVANAVENLRRYWMNVAMMKDASEYENMQVTIFAGEKLQSVGLDWEDLAICKRTITEFDAMPFMQKVIEVWEMMEYEGEIDEEEYMQKLQKLSEEYIEGEAK